VDVASPTRDQRLTVRQFSCVVFVRIAHAGLYRPAIRVSASAYRVRLPLSLPLPAYDPAAAPVVEEEEYVGPVAEEPGYAEPGAVVS
jgi:hypothetical protein